MTTDEAVKLVLAHPSLMVFSFSNRSMMSHPKTYKNLSLGCDLAYSLPMLGPVCVSLGQNRYRSGDLGWIRPMESKLSLQPRSEWTNHFFSVSSSLPLLHMCLLKMRINRLCRFDSMWQSANSVEQQTDPPVV